MVNKTLARRIGRNIAALRVAGDWSQAELAARVRIERSRLAKWENGDHVPPVESLVNLAGKLEVRLDDLVSEKSLEPAELLTPEQRKLVRTALRSLSRLVPTAPRTEKTNETTK